MNGRVVTLFVLLMVVGFVLAGCQQAAVEPQADPESTDEVEETDTDANDAAGDESVTVGYVLIDLSHPFHLGQVDGAEEAARRHGFDLRITSGEGDVNKQIEAFENLVNAGVDVIAVNFIDAAAFGPAMQEAEEAGIPVVCLHSEVEGCDALLGFDEWFTGRAVGEYSVEVLQESACWPECQVANLQGLLGQGLNEARSGGFVEVMEENNVEVVAQEPTDWQPEKAVSVMENWLVAYPDLDLVYGNSDGLTVPAAETTQAAGRDDVIFVSVDGSDFAMEAIQEGSLQSTFMYAPEYTGYWKVLVPYRIANGEDVPYENLIKGVLVNEDNVDHIQQLAIDQKEKITEFDFEKSLQDIIATYMAQ